MSQHDAVELYFFVFIFFFNYYEFIAHVNIIRLTLPT